MVLLLMLIYHMAVACLADHRYAFSCPPRLWIDQPQYTACRLTLSSGNVTTSVQISSTDGTDAITLQPGEAHIRVMDPKFPTDNGVQDKGVIVTSDQEVYCILEQMDTYNTDWPVYTDSTQLHPLVYDSDQYAHYLASFKRTSFRCADYLHTQFYTIASAEDNTRVEIYEGDELQHSVTLNQYQTYTYADGRTDSMYLNFDPTGLNVASDKPVSVISGALCEVNEAVSAFITFIQPRAYGEFVAPHLGNTWETGYTVKVISHEDNSRVTVNDDVDTVNKGDFLQVELPFRTVHSVISCDPPCTAYMATKGSTDGGKQASLLSIIPTAAMYTSAFFTTPDYDFPHYVSIVAQGGAPFEDIVLDGHPIIGQTWAILGSYSSTWFEISQGPHWLTSASGRRVAIYVYGHSGYLGGGYGHSVWP